VHPRQVLGTRVPHARVEYPQEEGVGGGGGAAGFGVDDEVARAVRGDQVLELRADERRDWVGLPRRWGVGLDGDAVFAEAPAGRGFVAVAEDGAASLAGELVGGISPERRCDLSMLSVAGVSLAVSHWSMSLREPNGETLSSCAW